ncbi:MAG: hypothetical protein H3C63_18555 [Candidatus Omnitrophica bacterium]|nr:hypothetical protein [Candidatus Omnitrophota bacterium]
MCGEGIAYDANLPEFGFVMDSLTHALIPAMAEYGSKKTVVLLISLDEGISLFHSIPQDSILRQVRWFGGDGLAGNASLVNDAMALQFALDTKLITFSPGNRSHDFLGIFERAWRDVLAETIEETPTTFSYMTYDAAWFLTMASVKEAYNGEEVSRKDTLVDLVNHTQGAFQFYRFNDVGDTQFGYTDFYMFEEYEGDYYWTLFAKYSYQITGENLYYAVPKEDTQVESWELY